MSATSKKMELKLTQVARASLEELRLDYEDFLRHRALPQWPNDDPRRADLVTRRCATADAVAVWIKEQRGPAGLDGPPAAVTRAPKFERAARPGYPELSANAALTLIGVACALLERQVSSLAAAFEAEGGFTERLYRVRTARRQQPPPP